MSAKILITIIGVIILLAGCVSTPNDTPTITDVSDTDDTAQIKLAEAAVSVSQSLQQLADMEKAIHPSVRIPPPPNPAAIGMAKLASVNWNGPAEPLIRKIAAASNYRVRVIGKQPAIPPLVSVSAQNTPLADILRDVSFQVIKKADIVLYPHSRVIEIRYVDH